MTYSCQGDNPRLSKLFCGYRITESAKVAGRIIKCKLNPLFSCHVMKSGETDTSVLAAIRENIYDIEINTKAQRNVSAKRKKANGEYSIVFTSEKPKDYWVNNRVEQYKNEIRKHQKRC